MTTECECPMAGYCGRHGVTKGEAWHQLCQTHKGYFHAWEKGVGPGQKQPRRERPAQPSGAAAWKLLHSYPVENAETWDENKAKTWYRWWLNRVPSYGCSCRSHWKAYTKDAPPPLLTAQGFFEWSVVAHNYVSTHHAEPRKEAITLQKAAKMYNAPWSYEEG